MADERQNDLLRQVKDEIDLQKREVELYYAELKLKLPTYLKSLTLKELSDKGAIIDLPTLQIPHEAIEKLRTGADSHRKKLHLIEKIQEIREHNRNHFRLHYENIKQQLPKDLLNKQMGDLSEEDWRRLGIDITRLGDKFPAKAKSASINRKK